MRWMWILALVTASNGVQAAEIEPERKAVLTCLEAMGEGTSWGECVGQLFSPCANEDVGSDGHVACLTDEHAAWLSTMDAQRLELVERLTSTGVTELAQLMGRWFGYVSQKCSDVATGKDGPVAEAAQLGCEISEIAGVTTEFVACHEGRSTAPYCVMQE